MTSMSIIKVFEKIRSEHLDYCLLCLRTENERQLHDTSKLISFLKLVNRFTTWYSNKIENNDHHVCFVCDAHLDRALHFMRVVSVSQRVLHLFDILQGDSTMVEYLTRTPPSSIRLGSLQRQRKDLLMDCEKRMDVLTGFTNMAVTETLNISCEPTAAKRGGSMLSQLVRQPVLSRSTRESDHSSLDEDLLLLHNEERVETVVIDDDSEGESTAEVHSEPVQVRTDNNHNQRINIIHNNDHANLFVDLSDDQNVDTDPLAVPEPCTITNTDIGGPRRNKKAANKTKGPKMVPIERLQDPNGTVPLLRTMLCGNNEKLHNNNMQYIMHPMFRGNDNMFFVPSLQNNKDQVPVLTSLPTNPNQGPMLVIQPSVIVGEPNIITNHNPLILQNNNKPVQNIPPPVHKITRVSCANPNIIIVPSTPAPDKPNPNTRAISPQHPNTSTVTSSNILSSIEKLIQEATVKCKAVDPQGTTSGNILIDNVMTITDAEFRKKPTNMGINQVGRERAVDGAPGTHTQPPQPILKANNIDWEIKIPMDVITYMDSVEPSHLKRSYPEEEEPDSNRRRRSQESIFILGGDSSHQ